MIYHDLPTIQVDLPWLIMIYHDLPWFTMIYHDFYLDILERSVCWKSFVFPTMARISIPPWLVDASCTIDLWWFVVSFSPIDLWLLVLIYVRLCFCVSFSFGLRFFGCCAHTSNIFLLVQRQKQPFLLLVQPLSSSYFCLWNQSNHYVFLVERFFSFLSANLVPTVMFNVQNQFNLLMLFKTT